MPDVQMFFPDGPSVCVVIDNVNLALFVDNEDPGELAGIANRRELEIAQLLLEQSLRNVNAALEIVKTEIKVVESNVTRKFTNGSRTWVVNGETVTTYTHVEPQPVPSAYSAAEILDSKPFGIREI